MTDYLSQSEEFAEWLINSPTVKGVRSGARIDGHCPLPDHDDGNPSFSYYVTSSGWKCRCGQGKASDLWERIGWSPSGRATLLPAAQSKPQAPKKVVKTYEYLSPSGEPLFRVLRYEPKSFGQEAYTDGRWITGKGAMTGVSRVPYRLPELLALPAEQRILIVDGEKDADTAWLLGYPATCHVGGMENWTPGAADFISSKTVTIVADRDEKAGKTGARKIQQILRDASGEKHPIIEMPGDGVKDLTDWVAAGGTLEALQQLAEQRESWESVARSPVVPLRSLEHLIGVEIEYLIYPIVPRRSLVMIQGSPKSGKSAYALFLALNAAAGFWPSGGGHYIIERPVKTLLVEYEDAEILVAQRASKYLAGLGRDGTQLPDNLMLCSYPDLFLDSARYCDALVHLAREQKIEFIIIDTLSYIHQAEDENSSGEMKGLMANLKRITRSHGFSILLIHHTGKGARDKVMSDRSRGSTVISAAPDVIIDWGMREKGKNITPVTCASKYDQTKDFVVEYQQQADGSVRWLHKVAEDADDDKETKHKHGRDESTRLIVDIQRHTKSIGGYFSMVEYHAQHAQWIGYNSFCRAVRRLENERLVSVKGSAAGKKEIMAINMDEGAANEQNSE